MPGAHVAEVAQPDAPATPGRLYARFLRRAHAVLSESASVLNRMNVFPVSDADTGTNLELTLAGVVAALDDDPDADRLAQAAVLSAHGNSGAIVAEMVVSITREIASHRLDTLSPGGGVARLLRVASAAATHAVAHPVAGTILTVADDAAQAAEQAAGRHPDDLVAVVDAARAAAATSLAETPTLLAVLAEAGVVDSGAQGYVLLLDVLAETLGGAPARPLTETPEPAPSGPPQRGQVSGGQRHREPGEATFEVMYALRGARPDALDALRLELSRRGESVVVVGDEVVAQVHVHLADAGAAVEAGLLHGTLSQLRITALPGTPATAGRTVIAVVAGGGLAAAVRGLGGVPVQPAGARVTIEELSAALDAHPGDLVLLPNDMESLELTTHLAEARRRPERRIAVIPTVAQVQGLTALAVHEPAADFDSAVVAMSTTAGHTRHGAVTIAEARAMTMAGRCEVGDVLGLLDGDFVEIGDTVARSRGADHRAADLRWRGPAHPHHRCRRRAGTGWVTAAVAAAATSRPGDRGRGGWTAALSAADRARLMAAIWRTELYRRLGEKLDRVIGDKSAKPFAALKVHTVADLVQLLPRRYFSGTELSDLAELRVGEEAAVMAEVVDCRTVIPPGSEYGRGKGGRPARVHAVIGDGRGQLNLAFFGSAHLVKYWAGQLGRGQRGIFAGKVSEFNGERQLAHPDFVILDDDGRIIGGAERNAALAEVSQATLVGLYPGTSKLRTWTVAACVAMVLDSLDGLSEPLPEWVRREAGVPEVPRAWRLVHQPEAPADVERGRKRLRFDEAFGLQLAMAYRRADAARHGAIPRAEVSGGILAAFDARLPFALTAGQQEVTGEIMTELAGTRPMQRLLQGEVGSGKTVVALRAMLATVDAGGQAALLAPTEVLAGQHLHTVRRLLGDLAVGGILAGENATDVVLITGSMSAAARRAATARAASGEAGIVIGTHALLSSGVEFADLGLVVVDEQHRFGVEQRAALSAKATSRPHVLVMTATPIPRSVAMTVFGDLEVSTLREVPAGRADVSTVVVDTARNPGWVGRAWQRIVEEVGAGRQAYVVAPRISKNDDVDAALELEGSSSTTGPPTSVEDLYAELSTGPLASLRVEMLHGRLSSEDKDAVMGRFAAGETDVLVATTVIEVGVDVPNASMMVICDADRFGISQLHQLRGRIGRGEYPGVCLLLSSAEPLSKAGERLAAVAATRDGFDLAEIDLEQRREGDVLGASQSGVRSSLRLLRVLTDADLIGQARAIADRCVSADPDLDEPGLADAVTAVELRAAGEWLDRS